MTDADTIAALRELQGRGWPVEAYGDGTALLKWPSGERYFIPTDGMDPAWAVGLMMGWAVACLEARGLRRLVQGGHLSDDADIYVIIVDGPTCKANGVASGQAPIELEALLSACLALPDARAA